MTDEELGFIAYQAYCDHIGFKMPEDSTATLKDQWDANPETQKGWIAVAVAVRDKIIDEMNITRKICKSPLLAAPYGENKEI